MFSYFSFLPETENQMKERDFVVVLFSISFILFIVVHNTEAFSVLLMSTMIYIDQKISNCGLKVLIQSDEISGRFPFTNNQYYIKQSLASLPACICSSRDRARWNMLTVYEKMVEPSLGNSWSRGEDKWEQTHQNDVLWFLLIYFRETNTVVFNIYSSPLEIYITLIFR